MENRALEFHGSYLGRIQAHRGEIILLFDPAQVHESSGKPGLDAGKLCSQKIRLRFTGADLTGDAKALPATVADGKLVAGGLSLYLLPLPFETRQGALLKLILEEEGEIEIRAEELKVEAEGDPEYLEDFP